MDDFFKVTAEKLNDPAWNLLQEFLPRLSDRYLAEARTHPDQGQYILQKLVVLEDIKTMVESKGRQKRGEQN